MTFINRVKQSTRIVVAVLLLATVLLPVLSQSVSAYGLLPNRSIEMSSSKPFVAGDAATTYKVAFNVATAGSVGGIVVEFCDDTPIIGSTTCSAITGFDIGTPTVSGQSANASTFTTASAATSHTLKLSAGSPVSFAANDTISFDLTSVKNPDTTNHTFYARIYTFAAAGGSSSYTLATPGTYIDAGGVALSTANQLIIVSKVQERLTFCVYTTGTGNDCTAKSGSTINLGDNNGVLDSNGPYVDKTAMYSIATNATGSAAVRVKGDTLKTGANSIAAAGAVAAHSTTGIEQFGFCTYQSAGAGMTVAALYDGTGGATGNCSNATQTSGTPSPGGAGSGATDPYFAFDTANTATTYGQQFATKPAGTFSTGTFVFIGNINNITKPGIYTTTLTFIATGTY